MALMRPAAVAGHFYPARPEELTAMLAGWLDMPHPPAPPAPKAIVAPHAGYIYSGALAADCHRRFLPDRDIIRRVVLMGPAHRVPLRGLATTSADIWATPLGPIAIDREALAELADLPFLAVNDAAHAQEHALEVHLPILKLALPQAKLVPFVVGQASPEQVATVLNRLWDGSQTRIVISSDLSHYHTYAEAKALDARTASAVEALDETALGRDQACGRIPLGGLIQAARQRGLAVQRVGLINSGDTAGDKNKVVGYGGWSFG